MSSLLLLFVAGADPAHAFTTRIHVAIANEIREALVDSGDGTIRLEGSGAAVTLSERDARAIVENPLQFRAGAIGPDNFVFPALTDPTHAIGVRPLDQCADLYALAESDPERAYALGCLLHGATDAVAHHYVNFLTGETFTLTPVTTGRETSFENVVRHIVAEAMIEDAALALEPELFEPARMHHDIPNAFVERALVRTDSPVWQRMVSGALPRFEAACDANPDAFLPSLLEAADLAPSEVVALLPVYVEVLAAELDGLGPAIEAFVADLQDPRTPDGATLGVTPGADGVLGTEDDETACSVSCPDLYVAYIVGVALIEPRPGEDPLWIEVADDLAEDLAELPAVYVQTIGNLSARVTGPVDPNEPVGPILDLDVEEIEGALEPIELWIDDTLSLSDEVVEELLPDWVIDVRDLLASVGIEINLTVFVERLIAPLVERIEEALREEVLGLAEAQLRALMAEIDESAGPIEAEFLDRLEASAPPSIGGHALDHLFDSGLWITSFNLAAVALSDPSLVLPIGDEYGGVGIASFDASYSVAWTQAARCPIAADALPFGHDVRGLLSVMRGGDVHRARDVGDALVECHDGDLDAFTDAPNLERCVLVDLDLLEDAVVHRGSVSRAFPPEAIGLTLACGAYAQLPEAPPPRTAGCDSGGAAGGAAGVVALAVLALTRRRRVLSAVAALAALALGSGCGADPAPTSGTPETGPLARRGAADGAAALRDQLGRTVWNGVRTVDGVSRPVQVEFRADVGLWAEILAPWGPGRVRELRSLVAEDDGETLVSVTSNPEGWPPHPDDGRRRTWTVEVRQQRLTLTGAGRTEVLAPGPVPMPPNAWFAEAYGFVDEGDVDDAFCDAVLGIDHATLFDFARGSFSLREDRAGSDHGLVPLGVWPAGPGFRLSRVPGFEGAAFDAPGHFVVRYTATLDHPGGPLAVRERDDEVEGALWVFAGEDVGSRNPMLEVHSLIWPDATADEPEATFPAGPVPIEVVVVQCTDRADAVDLEIDYGAGWRDAALAPVSPDYDPERFPPVF